MDPQEAVYDLRRVAGTGGGETRGQGVDGEERRGRERKVATRAGGENWDDDVLNRAI